MINLIETSLSVFLSYIIILIEKNDCVYLVQLQLQYWLFSINIDKNQLNLLC